MPHLTKFGIDNFRVFDKETFFEFAPITVLTGSNNSGKSSLLKALQLVKENIRPIVAFSDLNLEFFEAEHRLGALSTVLNDTKRNLKVSLPCFLPGWEETFVAKMEFFSLPEKAALKRITIHSANNGITILDYGTDTSNQDYRYINIQFLTEKWILPIKEKILDFGISDIIAKRINFILVDWQQKDYESLPFINFLLEKAVKTNHLKLEQIPLEQSIINLVKLLDQNLKLISNFDNSVPFCFKTLIKKLIQDGNTDMEELSQFFLNLNSDIDKGSLVTMFSTFINKTKDEWETIVSEHTDALSKVVDVMARSEKLYQQGDISNLTEVDLTFYLNDKPFSIMTGEIEKIENGRIKVNEITYQKDYRDLESKIPEADELYAKLYLISDLVNYLIKSTFDQIETVEFLEAARTPLKRIYSVSKHSSSFEHNLYQFFKYPIPPEGKDFLDKWVNNFNLEGVKIEYSNDNIATIKFGNRSMADLGYGISQLFTILLKIVTITSRSYDRVNIREYEHLKRYFPQDYDFFHSSTLIIEEPETNLHPKYQSLLADLFIDANKCFNIQFVLETHSEYLIRKLQYLTAKNVLTISDTVIYYFNDHESVKNGEERIKKINIDSDGCLSDNFGPGFLDEALNLKFELLKLKNLN